MVKRARLDHGASSEMDVDENGHETMHRRNVHSIQEWFITTPLRGETYSSDLKDKGKQREEVLAPGEWKRRRGRGVLNRTTLMTSYQPRQSPPSPLHPTHQLTPAAVGPSTPYLDTLVTRLTYNPDAPPSTLFIPSLHPWDGPRDYAPPLGVAFSHSAKTFGASDAKSISKRRLIAIAAEEGGVRVVDVDEGLGPHPDAQGWFWRAHGNAVLDIKWSKDDKRIVSHPGSLLPGAITNLQLTASGDATTRLHALDGPNPTLIASLTGHTSSVKSCTFFDPSGSSIDASQSSCIASTGRDGNILIYDVRAPGNPTSLSSGVRRSARSGRYSQGIEGFAPQIGSEIRPVMEIRAAHDPSRKVGPSATAISRDGTDKQKEKSISTLIALQSMPGRLASGAAHDA